MNILLTCGSYSWGGLEMQTLNLAKSLTKEGNNILLLVPFHSTLQIKAVEETVQVKTLNWKNTLLIYNIFRIRKIIRDFSPDIIHTQLSHDLWALSPALSRKSKTPLVLTRRMASNVSKKDWLHRVLYRKVDLVLCVSSFIRDNMIQTSPVPPEKIKVHYNGLDPDLFNPELYDWKELRTLLGIHEETIVIGFLGRFSFMKGHREFFEAGQMLQQAHPDKKLLFLVAGGDSFGEEEFGRETRESGKVLLGEENVLYTGETRNSAEVLSVMDILAFPSHEESFGNVLCEAGAMKIPVVASNSGGVPDIVIHDQTGLLFEPKNSRALADGISEYIMHPEKVKGHGKAARCFIVDKFEKNKQIEFLKQEYIDLINNRVLS